MQREREVAEENGIRNNLMSKFRFCTVHQDLCQQDRKSQQDTVCICIDRREHRTQARMESGHQCLCVGICTQVDILYTLLHWPKTMTRSYIPWVADQCEHKQFQQDSSDKRLHSMCSRSLADKAPVLSCLFLDTWSLLHKECTILSLKRRSKSLLGTVLAPNASEGMLSPADIQDTTFVQSNTTRPDTGPF